MGAVQKKKKVIAVLGVVVSLIIIILFFGLNANSKLDSNSYKIKGSNVYIYQTINKIDSIEPILYELKSKMNNGTIVVDFYSENLCFQIVASEYGNMEFKNGLYTVCDNIGSVDHPERGDENHDKNKELVEYLEKFNEDYEHKIPAVKYDVSENVKSDIRDNMQLIDKDVMEDSLMDKAEQWMNMTDCTDDEKMVYKKLADYYGQSLIVHSANLRALIEGDNLQDLKKQEDNLNKIRDDIYKIID